MKTSNYQFLIKLIFINIFTLCVSTIYPQQASDFFPDQTNFRWEFKVTPLDSANNEINVLTYFRHELYINENVFEGRLSKIVPTKSGPAETIHIQPYQDSLFYNFTGSDGYEYFRPGLVKNLFEVLDTLITDTTYNIVNFFNSLQKWYPIYRFAQNIGDDYTILQLDTTVTTLSQTLPLRLEFIGERLPDEIITTVFGNLDCKKFVRKIVLSYLIIINPLPPVAIPILTLVNYVWITQDYWIVKSIIPSTNVDLSIIGVQPFYIPGLITKLDGITDIDDEISIPNLFTLSQNYPNPFNPTTKIWYSMAEYGNVEIKVYDILGNEVATLVNETKVPGHYAAEFDASSFANGVYIYTIRTNNFVQTKKMILMK